MSALESAEALLFRLLERYAFVDDLESNSKSCVEQATELCCGIIEADRKAVALRAKRELLAEFKLRRREPTAHQPVHREPLPASNPCRTLGSPSARPPSGRRAGTAEGEAPPNAPAFTVLTCVYCGQEYPAGTPASGGDVAALTGHIAVCEKHPMRGLKAEAELLRKQLSDACDTIRNLVAQKHCANCLAALPAPPKGSTP